MHTPAVCCALLCDIYHIRCESDEGVYSDLMQTLAVSASLIMRQTAVSGVVKNDLTCAGAPDAAAQAPAFHAKLRVVKKALSTCVSSCNLFLNFFSGVLVALSFGNYQRNYLIR